MSVIREGGGGRGGIGPSRRLFLGALLASPVCFAAGAGRAAVAGACALDWSSAQALLALGLLPAGMPEIDRYRRLVMEPAVPDDVLDIGARAEPNLELLDRLSPGRFLTDGSLTPVRPRLERIAPVTLYQSFDPTRNGGQLAFARDSLRELAATFQVPEAGERCLNRLDRVLDAAAERLGGGAKRPLYLLSLLDGRRTMVYGRTSLYQDILDRLGLENAWTGPSGPYGHATVTLDRLAERPDAAVVTIGSGGAKALDALAQLPLFAGLPFLREGRVTSLPSISFYGGVPSAIRFARLLGERLSPSHD